MTNGWKSKSFGCGYCYQEMKQGIVGLNPTIAASGAMLVPLKLNDDIMGSLSS